MSISQLCRWFGVPRRTVYYRPSEAAESFRTSAQPIKQLIEEKPSFGYRTVAHLLSFNKNTVQRIFQLMRWQVRKRPVGFRPACRRCPRWLRPERALGDRSVPRLEWPGWLGRAGPGDRLSQPELLGWHLSRSGKSKTAEAALEQALIARYGTPRVRVVAAPIGL